MSFTRSGGGAALPPSRLRMLLQALDAAPAPPSSGEAQSGGRRGLIGSGYQAYMAQRTPSDAAGSAEFDPLLPTRASQPRREQTSFAQNTARPAGPVDPRTTDVFQPGPDGKLRPVPGWPTTGPFDVGKWAHNIDWGGVARDLSIAAAGIPGAAALKAPLTALDIAGLVGGFVTAGWETKHKQDEAIEEPQAARRAR
jgi:hypothetical protein